MQITDAKIGPIDNSNFSNLRNIFGSFCKRIFEYREEILSPIKGISSINEDFQNSESLAQNLEHQEDFRTIHHSISMILKAIEDSEKIASFQKKTTEILYAMTAIADEVFLNMDWNGKKYWEENMLESKFFGTQIAGDEIFNRINQLMGDSEPFATEKGEIYLHMLSMGFKGKFRGTEEESSGINMYRKKLYDFLTKHNKEAMITAEYRIFQKEYTYTMPTVRRQLLPDAAIVTYLSLFFIFMFLSVSTIAWLFETQDLSRLLNEISEIAVRGRL